MAEELRQVRHYSDYSIRPSYVLGHAYHVLGSIDARTSVHGRRGVLALLDQLLGTCDHLTWRRPPPRRRFGTCATGSVAAWPPGRGVVAQPLPLRGGEGPGWQRLAQADSVRAAAIQRQDACDAGVRRRQRDGLRPAQLGRPTWYGEG
jgi:hypothetical protein